MWSYNRMARTMTSSSSSLDIDQSWKYCMNRFIVATSRFYSCCFFLLIFLLVLMKCKFISKREKDELIMVAYTQRQSCPSISYFFDESFHLSSRSSLKDWGRMTNSSYHLCAPSNVYMHISSHGEYFIYIGCHRLTTCDWCAYHLKTFHRGVCFVSRSQPPCWYFVHHYHVWLSVSYFEILFFVRKLISIWKVELIFNYITQWSEVNINICCCMLGQKKGEKMCTWVIVKVFKN